MESPVILPPPLPVSAFGPARPRFHRGGTALALAVIVGCVVFVLLTGEHAVLQSAAPQVTPSIPLEIAARYGYGARHQLTRLKQWNATTAAEFDRSLTPLTHEPLDRFRAEIVRAAMNDRPPDDGLIKELVADAPWLQRDRDVLHELSLQGRAIPEADWKWFLIRHGWIARLARAQALPSSDPEWQALANESTRTVIVMMFAAAAAVASLLGGVVLLGTLVVRWWQGRLHAVLPRPADSWGGVLIEGFAIYLCGWTVLPAFLVRFLPGLPHWAILPLAVLVVPVAMFWPRWRGVDRQTWKQTLGLHTGQGVWREAGVGVLGWIAGLPFIALGMWAAQWIARMTHEDMSHPIMGPLTTPGSAQVVAALLAVVWAPLAEEVMFRGMLFPGLSAFLRWVAGALLSAFTFAVIHPQGWAAVPAIMAIALASSALRLLRGSLIASMALHAVNNGTLVLVLVLCTG